MFNIAIILVTGTMNRNRNDAVTKELQYKKLKMSFLYKDSKD